MLRRLMILAASMAALAGCGRNNIPSVLRYDGIYVANRETSTKCLRFYPDGTVLDLTVSRKDANPNQTASWFNRNFHGVGRGEYKTDYGSISFTTTQNYQSNRGSIISYHSVSVDYKGTVQHNALEFFVFGRSNGHYSILRFKFVKIDSWAKELGNAQPFHKPWPGTAEIIKLIEAEKAKQKTPAPAKAP